MSEPVCFRCGATASNDPYCFPVDGGTPADVAREDGTYNPESGKYACTACYIAIGQPSSPTGWRVPA